jgi:D-threo-aldose 1-dehydrogenase
MPNLNKIPSHTSRLGNTQVRIPRLGLGAAQLGDHLDHIPVEQAIATVHYALENGVPYFDTAPRYGGGESEKRLGIALKGVPRQSFVLATKIGWNPTEGERFRAGFNREDILRSLDGSMARLGMDHFDIVHIHDPVKPYRQVLDEVFPVLADLRAQGVIGAIGAGVVWHTIVAEFARHADFDCIMMAEHYNLLEHPQDALDSMALCKARGISMIIAGVYATGILATGAVTGATYFYHPASDEIIERVRHMEEICQSYSVPLRSVALQFPLAHPAVVADVVGAVKPEEVAQTLEGLDTPIPFALWADLRAAGLISSEAPLPEEGAKTTLAKDLPAPAISPSALNA